MGIVYVDNSPGQGGGPVTGYAGHSARRRCASCNDEILGDPVIRDGKCYCCEGCAGGGPCDC